MYIHIFYYDMSWSHRKTEQIINNVINEEYDY